MPKKKILISGMTCNHCAETVKQVLVDLGAMQVEVSLATNSAIVNTNLSEDAIMDALEEEGFDVTDVIDML